MIDHHNIYHLPRISKNILTDVGCYGTCVGYFPVWRSVHTLINVKLLHEPEVCVTISLKRIVGVFNIIQHQHKTCQNIGIILWSKYDHLESVFCSG